MCIFKSTRGEKSGGGKERTRKEVEGRENMLNYESLVRLRLTSLGRLVVNIIFNHNPDRESDFIV